MTIPKPIQETYWRTSDGKGWKTEEAAQQQEFILALAVLISSHIDITLSGTDCEAAACVLLATFNITEKSTLSMYEAGP